MDNRTIARHLMQRARCLADEDAGLYRVRAYRRAAESVLGLDEPLEQIIAEPDITPEPDYVFKVKGKLDTSCADVGHEG